MKKNVLFIVALILLHMVTLNPTDNPLLSFQFLAQGSAFCPFKGEYFFPIHNILLNAGMMMLLISRVCKCVSDVFMLYPYIHSRSNASLLKRLLVKTALKEIVFILLISLTFYIFAFIRFQGFNLYFIYGISSTTLTLCIAALSFIILKLSGAKDRIPLFSLVAGHMVALILSHRLRIFAIFTIASVNWQKDFLFAIPSKMIIIAALVYYLMAKSNFDKLLGGSIND